MKRAIALALILALLSGALAACAPQSAPAAAESTALPTPTPVPTPTPPPPEGMEKVFGRELSVAFYFGDGAAEFAAGALYEAGRLGIPVFEAEDAAGANAADICIGYNLTPEQAGEITVPLSLYTTDDRVTADALIYYDESVDLSALAWDVLFDYPAHESPIRLMALFDEESIPVPEEPEEPGEEPEEEEAEEEPEEEPGEESEEAPAPTPVPDPYAGWSSGARTFGEWQQQGKLQSRGYYHGPLDGAAPWLEEKLDGVIPGLLDTVYAENPALAKAGYEALMAANRNDAVEIISAGLDWDIMAAMIEEHFLMGAAVGPDRLSAGALALRRGLLLLLGETPEPLTLEPTAIYSDDVYALVKEGVTDPAAIAIALNPALNEQAQREEWAYLEEYYSEG